MARANKSYLDLTKADFIVYGSLDEVTACGHFFGKSIAEAEKLFMKNPFYYEEDLTHMGPRAFCVYFEAFVTYLERPASDDDSDSVSSFALMLELRLKHDRAGISAALPRLAKCCHYILKHWSRYGVNKDRSNDLQKRFRDLCESLSHA